MIRSIFLISVLLFLAGCGGLDRQRAAQHGPAMVLETWLKNPMKGQRILLDRNGNQVESAIAERSCEKKSAEIAWVCRVQIQYLYSQSIENYQENWSVVYAESGIPTVRMIRDGLEISGDVSGNVLWLKGKTLIPSEKEKKASIDLRFYNQPSGQVMEKAEFTTLGITVGSYFTQWEKNQAGK